MENSQSTQWNKKKNCFLKKSHFSNFQEKIMPLKLFDFLEQLMIDIFC